MDHDYEWGVQERPGFKITIHDYFTRQVKSQALISMQILA